MREPSTIRTRLPLLLMGGLALVAALWAGLLRLGWDMPPLSPTLAGSHGPLIVSGFLGTLIGLERAVALGGSVPLLVPAATGLGAVALITGVAAPAASLLMTLGSAGLVAATIAIVRRQTALHHITMAFGAGAWLVGNVLWAAGWPVYRVVLWWAGFLLLTIAGERLELSRVLFLSDGTRRGFALVIGTLLVALTLATIVPETGVRLSGLAMLALAAWLLSHDVARRTVRQDGLSRFIAVCMLSGYVWLAAGGLAVATLAGRMTAGPGYDAALHAIFLGFVFSMIFGHAPVILPAVLKVAVPFSRTFYAPLVLLHASLMLRIGGDIAGWLDGRRWGGLLNVVALLLFLANTSRVIRAGARRAEHQPPPSRTP